ncbi:hypothetical protein [Sorangium sp. So ce1335]|uniref:hypothetical protein n=1 Tax=Sorangium sp. So ce1335 TaxID=3133335 RepID=UPI003F62FC17
MKTIKTLMRCASFFGLVAVALPGCWSDAGGPVGPEDILCDKLAECGKLSEGVTADRCAANARLVHTQAVKELGVCKPVFEQLQSLMACVAQQEACDDTLGTVAADLPQGHPCFDENESYKQALQEVGAGSNQPDAGTLCAFHHERAMGLVTTPATGQACKRNADCPDVECPDPALGRGGYCQYGTCKTAIDLCDVGAPAAPVGAGSPPM